MTITRFDSDGRVWDIYVVCITRLDSDYDLFIAPPGGRVEISHCEPSSYEWA